MTRRNRYYVAMEALPPKALYTVVFVVAVVVRVACWLCLAALSVQKRAVVKNPICRACM